MDYEKPEKTMIGWNATAEERKKADDLKRVLSRASYSDLIRSLINEKWEKIFGASGNFVGEI